MDIITNALDSALRNLEAVKSGSRPGTFETVRPADERNRGNPSAATPDERRAMRRLERLLGSGEAPRTDVPRGYYLNIVV